MPTLQGFQILRSSAKLVVSSFYRKEAVRMNSDVDFAVAAWHEGGTWNLEILPDPYNLASVIKELQNHQTNGGALALIAIDEEFFILVRVLGTHISMFISDVTCALDYEVASEFLEIADLPSPEDDDEPLPGGRMDIITDLGMGHMELEALCDDTDLFPDEQLEAIAKRLGFSEEFVELLEL
jgi:putative tRNA adenosine deaminase-associated protein